MRRLQSFSFHRGRKTSPTFAVAGDFGIFSFNFVVKSSVSIAEL